MCRKKKVVRKTDCLLSFSDQMGESALAESVSTSEWYPLQAKMSTEPTRQGVMNTVIFAEHIMESRTGASEPLAAFASI